MNLLLRLSILWVVYDKTPAAMVMRNNALMTKMVSHFHKDRNMSHEPHQSKPTNVLALMQNVLCRNFPSIPCEMIAQDEKLRKLIEKSIQQIKYKKMSLDQTTRLPEHLTLFPAINNEDLSNFLQYSDMGFYTGDQSSKKKKGTSTKTDLSAEKTRKPTGKTKKEPRRTRVFNGRKKLRKFYPHKVKYKDKNSRNRKSFVDDSDEKMSMSVETPDFIAVAKNDNHLTYKREPSDPPVWRIDYMKHGEPNINVFGTESDRLKGKLIKTGPSVMVDENVLEQVSRRDVLHPDVYIKTNFVRKNSELNSEGLE